MKKTLTCIVVDDEPLAREGLEDYIARTEFLDCRGSFKNAVEASAFLARERTDLMFLDIHMPLLTGLEFLESLPDPPAVIFTTAYRQYAVEGFELEAADYLLKPISFARFMKAVNKVRLTLTPPAASPAEEQHFYVKEDGVMVKVQVEEVRCIEGVKDYIFIYTAAKRHMALTNLKAAEEKLDSEHFMRVHRSHIVNLTHVTALEGNLLHVGKHRIPVSKQHRAEVLERVVGNKLWRRE